MIENVHTARFVHEIMNNVKNKRVFVFSDDGEVNLLLGGCLEVFKCFQVNFKGGKTAKGACLGFENVC